MPATRGGRRLGDLAAAIEAETRGTVTCEEGGPVVSQVSHVSNDRAREEFGYEVTPFEESLRKYVDAVTA